jgi:16S rRNA (uracil1498-N3)-methyltransferase
VSRIAAHVLVGADALHGPTVALEPEAVHHFARVLRLRAGELVTVTDGAGALRTCAVPDDFAGSGELQPTGAVERHERPLPPVAIGVALAKADKPDLVVQKLTELGVDRIVLFEAERSVVRWDADKAAKALRRLRAVATEALQQSRGCFLPDLDLAPFAALAAVPGVVRADAGGAPPSLAMPLVLIGPEGGWSPSERAAVPATVGLAPTVLRAETAAVAAGALWVALRSRIVAELG